MEIVTNLEELSVRSEEVNIKKENQEVRDTIISLKNKVRDENLVGLAAPQIGVKKRIFVINFKGDVRTFINPVIEEAKGFTLSKEQCPSIPGKTFLRIRNSSIGAIYQTPLGKIESKKFLGYAAVTFQRLVDLLDGMVLSDVGLEIDEDFEKASEEERAEVINAYLDSLDLRQKKLEKEIEENPDLQQIQQAMDFIESVQKGETKLGDKVSINKEGTVKE